MTTTSKPTKTTKTVHRKTKKPFSTELFELNDPAKLKVLVHLGSKWYVNPARYEVDLTNGTEYAEVEVKQHWRSGPPFPYPTINLPERKGKYLHHGEALKFWVLSADTSHAMVIPATLVLESPLNIVPNKYVRYGERFYQVDVSKCEIVKLPVLISGTTPESEEGPL
jgi:hypothetical protein